MAEEQKLTPRETLWREHFLQHGNATRAAREAGYKCPEKSGWENAQKLKISWTEMLAAKNITGPTLVDRIIEGLGATVVKTAQLEGQITDERTYVDFATRHKYIDLALKLMAAYPALEKPGAADEESNAQQISITIVPPQAPSPDPQ